MTVPRPLACTGGATLTPNLASPQSAGSSIAFTFGSTCATGDTPEYRLWIENGGVWSVVQDYSTASTFTWDTTGLGGGTFSMELDVRAAGSSAPYESYTYESYSLNGGCSGITPTISSSPASPQTPGTPVTFTFGAACSSPEYQLWVLPPGGGWSLVSAYGANSGSFAWDTTGLAAGTYDLEVDVRTQGSSTGFESHATASYALSSSCTGTPTLTGSPPSPSPAGSQISFTFGGVTCGAAMPQYRLWIEYPSTGWTLAQDYSTQSTYSWDTSALGLSAGTYNMELDVSTAGGAAPPELSAYSAYTLSCASPLAACGNACVDVATDSQNCGACGHSCQGGTCSGSTCQPITLASGLAGPTALVVDSTSVYWSNIGTTGNNFGDGSVMKVAIGGGSTQTLASSQPGAFGIAVDANSVYWGAGISAFSVFSMPISGGTASTVASGASVSGVGFLVVDSNNVYWTTGGSSVLSAPLGGGSVTPIASISSATTGIAIGGGSLYFASDNTGTTSTSDVFAVGTAGGAATTLGTGSLAYGVAVDSANVYWADYNVGTISSVPLGGGAVTVLASGQNGPDAIAVDSANVYWTNDSDGTVMRVPLGGGPVTTVASNQGTFLYGIAVDATSVYWTAFNNGTVMKIAK